MSLFNADASTFHKDTVLAVLLHHMGQDMRRKLMVECPAAYNDVCCGGRGPAVRVVYVDDGAEVRA